MAIFYNEQLKPDSNGLWVSAKDFKKLKYSKNAEITRLRECLEEKNKQLDMLHHVWCNGGCNSGIHRTSENTLTEEQILRAERYIFRLRTWICNHNFHKFSEKEKKKYFRIYKIKNYIRNFLLKIYWQMSYDNRYK